MGKDPMPRLAGHDLMGVPEHRVGGALLSGWVGVNQLVGEVLATAFGFSTTLDDLAAVYEAPAVGAAHLHCSPKLIARSQDVLRS